MHVLLLLLLLLLDTVPCDINIGGNDSTPTTSVSSPPERITSFLPGSERRQIGEGKQTNSVSVFYPSCYLYNFM